MRILTFISNSLFLRVFIGALLLGSAQPALGVLIKEKHNMLWAEVIRPEELVVTQWNTPLSSIPDPVIPAATENTPSSILLSYPGSTDPVLELSDDYFGWLDLTIEGLAPGQTVRVERFQVLERAGSADELALRQSFLVTDGALRMVGDAFNINMPNDVSNEDPAARDGRILVQLDYYQPSASTIIGDYLYRVSSPHSSAGAPSFAPLEFPFSVVSYEADAPQGLIGTVFADGVPVPDAMVVKVWQLSGYADILTGTFTNEDGDYFLPSEERNEFDFLAIKEGYVSQFGAGVAVNLEEDVFLTHDIELVQGTETLSGTLKDSVTGEPLPGVEIFFLNTSDEGEFISRQMSVTWTDETGNFTAELTPGQWGVIVRPETAYTIGYVTTAEFPLAVADMTTGDVSGLEVELKRATALIAGTLTSYYTDEGIFGVKIGAVNRESGEGIIGVTDGAGNYRLGVTPGAWSVSPVSNSLEDADHSGVTNVIIDLPSSGSSVIHDIEAFPADADVYGTVYDLEGIPVGRLPLLALNTDLDIEQHVVQTTFETDGEYSIFLPEGNWSIIPVPLEVSRREEKLIFIGDISVTVDPFELGFTGEIEQDIQVIRVDESTPRIQLTLTDEDTLAPIPNIYLHAFGVVDGETLHSYVVTDENGIADIPVFYLDGEPTTWEIHFSQSALQNAGKKEILDTISVLVDGPLATASATTTAFENPSLTGELELSQFGLAGGLTFTSEAESGRIYNIQSSDDLTTWRSMGQVRGVDGAVRLRDFTVTEEAKRFYRLKPVSQFDPSE